MAFFTYTHTHDFSLLLPSSPLPKIVPHPVKKKTLLVATVLPGLIILEPLQPWLFFFFFLALYVLAGASFFSILWSSLISLHTLQALWLNYVLRSMSKHGRCVICREFPFIHYYSEG